MESKKKTTWNYQLTKYPLLFDNYWGNIDAKHTSEIIFTNRNTFAEKYGLVKYISDKPKYILKELDKIKDISDHIECYLTCDNCYLIIRSPYESKNSDTHSPFGWEKIDRLYDSANTYLKIFNKKR